MALARIAPLPLPLTKPLFRDWLRIPRERGTWPGMWNLAWYNDLLDGGGSLGALAAGLPLFLQHRLSFSLLSSYRVVFFGYSGLFLIVAILCAVLSPAVEVNVPPGPEKASAGTTPTNKRILTKLTALCS